MAAVVREEIWFDSTDGVSRVHGYVWWPEGTADESVLAAVAAAMEVDDEAADTAGSGRHMVAADAVASASAYVEPDAAIGAPDGDDPYDDDPYDDDASADVDARGGNVPCGVAPTSNPFEAAVRAAAAKERTARLRVVPQATSPAQDGSDVANASSPASAPAGMGVRGVVQLVHGMAEHIARYDAFARFLAEKGYVVCGHDHVGHGKTSPRELWGCLPARGGRDVLVGDVGLLRSIMRGRVSDEPPYFLFGHSLGSFVVRAYVAHEGAGLAGAIICGTGNVAPVASSMGHALSRTIAALRGDTAKSRLLNSMGVGGYAKAVRHRRTANDWLSYNEANVDAYGADEMCGFPFSAGGYATVTALTKEVCTPRWAARLPKLLPLLFIGGNADPVGDNGEGVRASARLAREAGCGDVTCMIYKRMRHEILNEIDRQMVFDDVLFWLEVRS